MILAHRCSGLFCPELVPRYQHFQRHSRPLRLLQSTFQGQTGWWRLPVYIIYASEIPPKSCIFYLEMLARASTLEKRLRSQQLSIPGIFSICELAELPEFVQYIIADSNKAELAGTCDRPVAIQHIMSRSIPRVLSSRLQNIHLVLAPVFP